MNIQNSIMKRCMAALLAFGIFGAQSLSLSLPANAEGERINLEATMSGDVDALTKDIFHNEVELARLTTEYRLHNPRETKLHKWWTAGMSTVAYAVVDAGNITTFTNAFKFQSRPQDLNLGTAETGPLLIFLGEILFFTRTASITIFDVLHHFQIKKNGWDRKTFETRASQLETKIHSGLERRASLIGTDQSLISEQAVLTDLSNSLTKEFCNNYARSKKIAAFHTVQNIMFNYTAAVGCFVGGLLEYEAAAHTRPRTAGPSGIGFIASGVGFMTADLFSHIARVKTNKRVRAEMEAKYPNAQGDPLTKLDQDRRLLATASPAVASRAPAYGLMQQVLRKDVDLTQVEEKRELHKYFHDQFINFNEGAANIGAGTILAVAGFRFNYQPNQITTLGHFKHFLKEFAWSALTFTPTASGGLIDTPVEALYGEKRNAKDCREHVCEKVGAADRLSLLDQANATIK